MKARKWDIFICIFLIAFLAVFTFELRNITPIARIYPLCVIIGSFAMIAIVLFQAVKSMKKPAPAPAEGADPPLTRHNTIRIVIYCVAILVYILLIDRLGYILSTIAFAVYSLIYQKNKSKIVIVALPVIFALLMYYIFSNFLFVTLPTGSWIEMFL